MTFVEHILHQMPQLSKPRFHFLVALFHALSCFVGRATMLNLSRYGAGSPPALASLVLSTLLLAFAQLDGLGVGWRL